MGYRSKVIIGVKEGRLSDEFDGILKKHDFPVDKPDGYYLKIGEKDGMKTYIFDDIKWYDFDDWCKEIMDWLDETQFNKLDSCFCVGMGEEGETHSKIGNYYDFIILHHDITLN